MEGSTCRPVRPREGAVARWNSCCCVAAGEERLCRLVGGAVLEFNGAHVSAPITRMPPCTCAIPSRMDTRVLVYCISAATQRGDARCALISKVADAPSSASFESVLRPAWT